MYAWGADRRMYVRQASQVKSSQVKSQLWWIWDIAWKGNTGGSDRRTNLLYFACVPTYLLYVLQTTITEKFTSLARTLSHLKGGTPCMFENRDVFFSRGYMDLLTNKSVAN